MAANRVGTSLEQEIEAQARGDETLCHIYQHWHEWPVELKDNIKFLIYRGAAGRKDPIITVADDDEIDARGHVYLSDGSIPSDDEWEDFLKRHHHDSV